MRYFGGKSRIGSRIASQISAESPRTYWEPFCGMFSVGKSLSCARWASDLHPDLIRLLTAVQGGWEPPDTVTEEEYLDLKIGKPSALRGFVGFGCSNSGKFFGGYARQKEDRNFALNAKNSLRKLSPLIQGVKFSNQSYLDETFSFDVIYCDPPYRSTTGFTTGQFDHEQFWNWVRQRGRCVLVSEYQAPDDFEVVWEKQVRTDMNSENGKIARTEKLFRLR